MDRHLTAIIIVMIVMVAIVLKSRYASLGRQRASAEDPEAMRLREEVRTLKERIAVLERIATEKEHSLEREIEQLRDR